MTLLYSENNSSRRAKCAPSVDNFQAARELCIRQTNDGMGSKANHPDPSNGDIVTVLCSVNSTGLVFLATKRLKVCSEVTLTVQTSALGDTRDWTVQGWVVECRSCRKPQTSSRYKVTLLFSDLPAELRTMLMTEENVGAAAYPAVEYAPVFGLN
jgi:hypothetical protein